MSLRRDIDRTIEGSVRRSRRGQAGLLSTTARLKRIQRAQDRIVVKMVTAETAGERFKLRERYRRLDDQLLYELSAIRAEIEQSGP